MTDDSGWWWASLLGAAATVTVVPLIIAVNILSGEGGTGELHHSEFTAMGARKIGDDLGVDWSKIDLEQFRAGLGVELEHGLRDPQTNVTNDDPALTGKIAWAHLKELPDYYTRLKQVEEKMSSNPPVEKFEVLQSLFERQTALIEHKFPTSGISETLISDAGDIYREMTERNPDRSYIAEKQRELQSYIFGDPFPLTEGDYEEIREMRRKPDYFELKTAYEDNLFKLKQETEKSDIDPKRKEVMFASLDLISGLIRYIEELSPPKTGYRKLEATVNHFFGTGNPDHETTSNPGITRLNVDAELDTVRAAKIRDWSAMAKYPPWLIQRATRLADEWAAGLAQTYFPDDLELQRKFVEKNYSKGLDSADKWLQGVTK